jgi:tetratricopeptide (TPR) repeat protein
MSDSRGYLVAICWCALLLTGPVAAQSIEEWKTLTQEAATLYRQGKYDQAVVVAKKALEVAEKSAGPDHPDVAQSLNNLALLYRTQGQYAQAEPLLLAGDLREGPRPGSSLCGHEPEQPRGAPSENWSGTGSGGAGEASRSDPGNQAMMLMANKALHLTAIPLRSIAVGELGR